MIEKAEQDLETNIRSSEKSEWTIKAKLTGVTGGTTSKGRFCRAKAFICNNNAADRLTASWFAIEKQENERNVRDPKVCSGFSLRGL